MTAKLKALIQAQPLWLRKAEADTIAGFVPTLLVMSAINTPEAGVNAAAAALGVAALKAAQRNLGAFLAWTNDVLGLNND